MVWDREPVPALIFAYELDVPAAGILEHFGGDAQVVGRFFGKLLKRDGSLCKRVVVQTSGNDHRPGSLEGRTARRSGLHIEFSQVYKLVGTAWSILSVSRSEEIGWLW